MKTEIELQQLLKEFSCLSSGDLISKISLLAEETLLNLIQYHNELGHSGAKSNSLRLKMYNELFKRHGIGRAQTKYLSSKQRSFLESLKLLPVPKSNLLDGLDRIDRLIIQYLKQGYTQAEIAEVFKKMEISPNSLSIIEKRLKVVREKLGAKTLFHLAVILYGK